MRTMIAWLIITASDIIVEKYKIDIKDAGYATALTFALIGLLLCVAQDIVQIIKWLS